MGERKNILNPIWIQAETTKCGISQGVWILYEGSVWQDYSTTHKSCKISSEISIVLVHWWKKQTMYHPASILWRRQPASVRSAGACRARSLKRPSLEKKRLSILRRRSQEPDLSMITWEICHTFLQRRYLVAQFCIWLRCLVQYFSSGKMCMSTSLLLNDNRHFIEESILLTNRRQGGVDFGYREKKRCARTAEKTLAEVQN